MAPEGVGIHMRGQALRSQAEADVDVSERLRESHVPVG